MKAPAKKNGMDARITIPNSTPMLLSERTCGENGNRRIAPRHNGSVAPARNASLAGAAGSFRSVSDTKWNIPPDPRPNNVMDNTRKA